MKIKKITEKTVKMALLLVFSLFTAFPFVWMVISALKTKTELMDMSKFFPTECQWNNFYEVIFNSPLLKYVWNSFFVSVVTLVIQLVTAAMIAYAIVFMKFKGRKVLFAVIMGTYMLPTAATYIPGNSIPNDKIILHYIRINEFYYIIQQLYVAVINYGFGR